MALYEYFCESCQHQFEQLTSSRDPDAGTCPRCQTRDTRKLISCFAVGGRGDLRESTMHGCHDCHVPLGAGGGESIASHESHGHGHDHGHGHAHDE